MKFHLIAGALVCISGYLVYALLFGFHSDLEGARVQIQKESVKSLRDDKKVQAQDHYAAYINKSLVRPEPKPIEQRAEVTRPEDPPPTTGQSPSEDLVERNVGEKNYWCRNVPVQLETNPVKCLYPNACYGCDGPIIRPEIEGATPLCANGQQSQIYHVECCPLFTGGQTECPSADSCFEADTVPNDFCSCNNRPECRLVFIGSGVQCACIQN